MNNATIICAEAVASGFYTEQEIEKLADAGKMPDFHTYNTWKTLGMVPKRGSKGWQCRLWRKKDKRSDVKEEDVSENELKHQFYLTKSFLFDKSQCELLKED